MVRTPQAALRSRNGRRRRRRAGSARRSRADRAPWRELTRNAAHAASRPALGVACEDRDRRRKRDAGRRVRRRVGGSWTSQRGRPAGRTPRATRGGIRRARPDAASRGGRGDGAHARDARRKPAAAPREAEHERRRIAELLDAERTSRVGERADPARRVSPRRAKASSSASCSAPRSASTPSSGCASRPKTAARRLERESRAEIERLRRRLSASEREAQALGSASGGRRSASWPRPSRRRRPSAAQLLGNERALRSRIGELERARAERSQRALEAERAARKRAEHLLDALREAQRVALGLLGGLADTVARLREASIAPGARAVAAVLAGDAAAGPAFAASAGPRGRRRAESPAAHPRAPAQRLRDARPAEPAAQSRPAGADARSEEMAEALAAAVRAPARTRRASRPRRPRSPAARKARRTSTACR